MALLFFQKTIFTPLYGLNSRIANDTEFNTQKLINGGIKAEKLGELGFHIGANEGQRGVPGHRGHGRKNIAGI